MLQNAAISATRSVSEMKEGKKKTLSGLVAEAVFPRTIAVAELVRQRMLAPARNSHAPGPVVPSCPQGPPHSLPLVS